MVAPHAVRRPKAPTAKEGATPGQDEQDKLAKNVDELRDSLREMRREIEGAAARRPRARAAGRSITGSVPCRT